ncbi:MAG: hypothetical protein MJZ46_08010, partial [Bacteroidales bacterium]|nr:hypothetical protein [Bacteroidales bacterium]
MDDGGIEIFSVGIVGGNDGVGLLLIRQILSSDIEFPRFVFLGDLFVFGEESAKYHYEVGEYIATNHIDELLTVGEMSLN